MDRVVPKELNCGPQPFRWRTTKRTLCASLKEGTVSLSSEIWVT